MKLLKLESHLPKKCFYWFHKSPIRMTKNAFYLMLKALFVLEVFTFLSWCFGYVEKWLDKKAMVTYKIYHVTDWTIQILPNISRYKGNQKMKLVHSTEYHMGNIFLEKHTQSVVVKLVPHPFCKKWRLSISLGQ